MKRLVTFLAWIVSLSCLALSAWLIFMIVTLPGSRMGDTIVAALLPLFLSLGVVSNPLIFVRLPFARTTMMRIVVAAAVVAFATAVGSWFSQAVVLEHYRSLTTDSLLGKRNGNML